MLMRGKIVRCTIEMDLVEGDHFNSIGFDEDPIEYATDEQAHKWAKNTFIEYLSDAMTNRYGDNDIADWIQTKIVEEVS